MGEYQVWQNAWKENPRDPLTISLPDDWRVSHHTMEGDGWTSLTRQQMREKIHSPVGSPTIGELAKNGREAVIVFDDLSRGTPVKEIAELVLEELLANGIGPDHIRFLCALGTHSAHTRQDFIHKLGEHIVLNYPIFNHNPYENCVKIGEDAAGCDVEINREFMLCDVRIGIGMVAPHPMNGFGGGGKLLFPGIASMRTTAGNHGRREFEAPGCKDRCGLRSDIEAMTRMVGSFFKIDVVLNAKLDVVDLFAGDAVAEYYRAVEVSAVANRMEPCSAKDVVIVNGNAKCNEAQISVNIGMQALKPGGDLVLINHCPTGLVVHYLLGTFGKNSGGQCWTPYARRKPYPFSRLIYFTPYPDYNSKLFFNEPEKVVFCTEWKEVLALLAQRGAGTEAAILSDATISYFKKD